MSRLDLDLSGKVIKITTIFNSDYEYDVTVKSTQNALGNPEYTLISGYSVEIFRCLQILLNFTYVINSKVGIYGFVNSSNDVDLYLAAYSLYEARAKNADPTFVTGKSSLVAFVNHEFDQESKEAFISPFGTKIRILFTFTSITFIISSAVLSYFEGIAVGYSVFCCFATLLRQSIYNFRNAYKNNSTRIATFAFSFFALIISTSHTGILTSHSAIDETTITSMDTLLGSNHKIFIESGLSNNTMRMMLENLVGLPQVRALLLKLDKTSENEPNDIEHFIKSVHNSSAAFIIDEETGFEHIKKHLGSVPRTWGRFSVFRITYPWSMFLKKNSSFKPAINYGITRIWETGNLQNIRRRTLPPEVHYPEQFVSSFRTIGTSRIRLVYYVLGVSMPCSFLILIIECILINVKWRLLHLKLIK